MDIEITQLLGNLSLDELDDVIGRMERMRITNQRDNDVIGLVNAMNTLSIVANTKKLAMAIDGVKKHRKKVFVARYESLKNKKAKKVTSTQIDDIFSTMDALKQEEESMDFEDIIAEFDSIDFSDDVSMSGGAKGRRRRMKGGFKQMGPYEVHSRWPRFKIDQSLAVRDLKSYNERGVRALKQLRGGKKIVKKVTKKSVKKPVKKPAKKPAKKSTKKSTNK